MKPCTPAALQRCPNRGDTDAGCTPPHFISPDGLADTRNDILSSLHTITQRVTVWLKSSELAHLMHISILFHAQRSSSGADEHLIAVVSTRAGSAGIEGHGVNPASQPPEKTLSQTRKKVKSMTDRPTLTKRQEEVYDFIREKIMNRGYGPTVREIGAEFGIKSPNGVMCHLKALEKKGLISRESYMSRAIQLTDQPQLKRTSLPLAGQIAAGSPALAVEDLERIDFASLLDDDEETFCLRVRGDSMIEDQIAEGDYVIVRKTNRAKDGDIVVALVDDDDATLKRFYREADRIRLQPANKRMKPIYSTNVSILGVVKGVIRDFAK